MIMSRYFTDKLEAAHVTVDSEPASAADARLLEAAQVAVNNGTA